MFSFFSEMSQLLTMLHMLKRTLHSVICKQVLENFEEKGKLEK